MRISDWSSDVCSSDLRATAPRLACGEGARRLPAGPLHRSLRRLHPRGAGRPPRRLRQRRARPQAIVISGGASDGIAAAADQLEEAAHLRLELQRRDLLAVEEAAQFIGRVSGPREARLGGRRAGDTERRQRSEGRRVGKEWVSTVESRWWRYH